MPGRLRGRACGTPSRWRRRLWIVASRIRRLSGVSVFAGAAEYRQTLLQEMAHHRHPEQVAGGPRVVRLGGVSADRRPVRWQAMVMTEPCQRHQVGLLVLRQTIDERVKLLQPGRGALFAGPLAEFVDDEADGLDRYRQCPGTPGQWGRGSRFGHRELPQHPAASLRSCGQPTVRTKAPAAFAAVAPGWALCLSAMTVIPRYLVLLRTGRMPLR